MTPEPYPTPWRWVDLGLPSGTLWLDRLVGAPSPTDFGLFYQWGSVNGHSISDGFVFNEESYQASGANLINTELTDNQDAARVYYGETAKMPSAAQIDELIQYCSPSSGPTGTIMLTSSINGNSINLKQSGYIDGNTIRVSNHLNAWSRSYNSPARAPYLNATVLAIEKNNILRYMGLNIMAVHS